jgi:hypothetical protein
LVASCAQSDWAVAQLAEGVKLVVQQSAAASH